jgi:iron complex transport system substrate-binding protein
MEDDNGERFTRRGYLTGGAGILASGLLAGCTGGAGGGSGDAATTEGETTTTVGTTTEETTEETTTEETTTEETATAESYSVTMEPVGEVTFDSVPETWVANNGSWADMGAAIGLEPPEGVWLTGRYHTKYYDPIPDVAVDKSDMVSLSQGGSVSKELFYDFDADVHVMDPNFLANRFGKGWSESDIEDVREIGPFFGNTIFSRGYGWHSDYRYYSLMEAFEKFARAFGAEDRYEAFAAVHENLQENVAPAVPARSERPSAAVIWGAGAEPETLYPYIIGEGTSFKHMRDLGVRDALADTDVKNFHSSRGAIDFETLLDVNPETILLRGQEAKSESEFREVVTYLENHQTASEIKAVENGNVYRAGGLYQGPITNLVLTQRLAEDLYGVEETLYDPERVSDIVNGNL